MTVRKRHAFLDFIAILALASWSEDATAQVISLINQLGVVAAPSGCIEPPFARRSGRAGDAAHPRKLSCAKPSEPQRSPHRPRRDEVRSRAPHLRGPVRDREAPRAAAGG